jgi:peptidoglycan/xylan/chitin deacetylase (PgdA/CDA1 family)
MCSGLHGYSHENPTALNVQQQKDILEHTYKQLTDFCGKPPKGSVAPWWEVSKETAEMLLDKGISYGAIFLKPRIFALTDGQTTRSIITIVSRTGLGWAIVGKKSIIPKRPRHGWNH